MKTAITGGIGSGKSHVCRLLTQHGITIYDCDSAAKRLMHESPTLRRSLSGLIGPDAYTADGRLNKSAVAAFLMASPENQQRINDLVHPAVAADFRASGLDWMECAILFESGFDRLVDRIICVTAPEDLRVARIMQRDGITADAARQWIARQQPQQETARRSDIVINNDGRDLAAVISNIATTTKQQQ